MSNSVGLSVESTRGKKYGIHGYDKVPNQDADTYKIRKYHEDRDLFKEFVSKIEEMNPEMTNKIMVKSNTQIDDKGGYKTIVWNKKCNYVYNNGKLISKERFKKITPFEDDIAGIQREDGKRNYINLNGKILSKFRFDKVGKYKDGKFLAKLGEKVYFIDDDFNIKEKK